MTSFADRFRREAKRFDHEEQSNRPSEPFRRRRGTRLIEMLEKHLAAGGALPMAIGRHLPPKDSCPDAEKRWRLFAPNFVRGHLNEFAIDDPDLVSMRHRPFVDPSHWVRGGTRMPAGWDPRRDGGGLGREDVRIYSVRLTGDVFDGEDWTRYFTDLCRVHAAICRLIAELLDDADDARAPAAAVNGDLEPELAAAPTALTSNDRLVMETLAKFDPMVLPSTAEIIEAMEPSQRLSDKTIRKSVALLIKIKLAERPRGPNDGARLTTMGLMLRAKITD